MRPDISIIIPNLNSPFIGHTLAALRRQAFDMRRVEIIVVGRDEPGLVQPDKLVRLLETDRPTLPGPARNLGMQAARGDIFCFIDADCLPAPHWLACLIAALRENPGRVVGGGVTFDRRRYWTWCDNLSWFHEFLTSTPPGPRAFLPSLNLAVPRAIVEQVGYFANHLATAEDIHWTTRLRLAGYPLHFEPRASLAHHPSRNTLASLWRHAYTFGRNSIGINPRYARLRSLPLGWLVLWLAAPALAAWMTARILAKNKPAAMLTAPGLYLAKLAWAIGAGEGLRSSR